MKTNMEAKLKKIIILPVFAILILGIADSLIAAEGLILTVSEEEGLSDQQVDVTVMAENAAGIEGGQFILNFDPALVEPVSEEPGELIEEADSNLFMINKEFAEGQLKFMWVTPRADTADSGEICTITFNLLKEGETALEMEDIVLSPDGAEAVSAVPGRITIGDAGVDPEENEVEPETVEPEEDVIDDDNDDEEVAAAETDTNNTTLFVVIIVTIVAAGGYAAFRKFGKTAKKKHAKIAKH